MVGLKWNWENMVQMYEKETPAQVFSGGLCKTLRESFFKEHVWMTASDLGKYLKTLAIIIAFAEYIWIFGIWSNLKTAFKAWYYLEKSIHG